MAGRDSRPTGSYQRAQRATVFPLRRCFALEDPAPENKDNDLCWRYLAHRLDVEPTMVPRPFTKVVGIKQLAYFDAPRHKDDKPFHIGDFPAAVFETVDPK